MNRQQQFDFSDYTSHKDDCGRGDMVNATYSYSYLVTGNYTAMPEERITLSPLPHPSLTEELSFSPSPPPPPRCSKPDGSITLFPLHPIS
jgi:hypothetical protein